EHLPWVVEELDAAAEAAGVDPLALFAASVEELEDAPRGCTDVVVGRLVAHNNDLDAADEEDVVAIEWRVEGEPAIFTLGIGPWISVGWNEAGLSVTGNELDPNDERVGIPRLLQMRDVLTRTRLEDAVDAVLHPARASSYNWVLASPEGAVNVEGSATAAEVRRRRRLATRRVRTRQPLRLDGPDLRVRVKPKPLPPGGTIGVPAPASPYENRSEILRGIEWWESKGYRVKLSEAALARDDYVA